ncbi:MAG: hypothetical protein QOE62_516, partial [Actinomycetota bacterium]|nr:hypothetical protein [Actinomycetota bacterium]
TRKWKGKNASLYEHTFDSKENVGTF